MPSSSIGTVRAFVTEQITPHLPERWRIADRIPTLRNLDRPIVWLEYTGFEPLAEAPNSHVAAKVDICIATNLRDERKGEADADDAVMILYGTLFHARAFYDMTATKAVFEDAYFGWRISTTIPTLNKE